MAEVKKLATGRNSSEERSEGNQNREINPDTSSQTSCSVIKRTRNKWTREEYKQIMIAFYTALNKPERNITDQCYTIWREAVGKNFREYIDPNKLSNLRSDIMRNHRLTPAEIEAIKTAVNTNLCDQNEEYIEQVNNIVQMDSHTDEGFQDRKANRPEIESRHESGPGTTINDSFATDNEEKIREAGNDILREYSTSQHTEMQEREQLPKFQCKRSKLLIVRIYDYALMQLLKETENDLKSLNHFIYATSLAATKKMGIKLKKKAPIKMLKSNQNGRSE